MRVREPRTAKTLGRRADDYWQGAFRQPPRRLLGMSTASDRQGNRSDHLGRRQRALVLQDGPHCLALEPTASVQPDEFDEELEADDVPAEPTDQAHDRRRRTASRQQVIDNEDPLAE